MIKMHFMPYSHFILQFKTNNQLSFEELRTFMTQLYPENVKNELKTATVKCKGGLKLVIRKCAKKHTNY